MASECVETPDVEPIVMIVGEKVALGPIRDDLALTYQRWMNDFRMLRTLRGTEPLPMTVAAAADILSGMTTRADEAAFTIYDRETMPPVGTTVIAKIDYRNRTAICGVEIGEPGAR